MFTSPKLLIFICSFCTFGLSAAENPKLDSAVESERITILDSILDISEYFDQAAPLDSSAPPKLRPMPDDDPGIPPGKWSCPDWPICEMYEVE